MARAPCYSQHPSLNRGAWTAHEDYKLARYIKIHGEGRWRSLPHKAGLKRCGKSCRTRWLHHLHPDVKRGNISADEEELIVRLQGLLGNRWAMIAGRLPSRTANEIKNYWNTHITKKTSREKETILSDRVWKSIPVKTTLARKAKGPKEYPSFVKENHDLNSAGSSQISRISKCLKKDDSQSLEFSIVESGFPSPCYSIQDFHTDEVEQASLSLKINVEQAMTFIEEQEIVEIIYNTQQNYGIIEPQDLQKSSMGWLSTLLLESEED
ncbi:hypothetical protein SUGI_1003270 [Cryptomeria japonica]|uniref:transcription factor MYB1-like n=1 Tax=Cryptomeria japonica TaxID=3369 RepID=UPI00241489FB|nr:transcription factor MYB1-like [Cryptomeria japonica]GLJ47516.1 hypothetical protein SUGI_1003270 [Cryptomeria japonica]